MLAKLKVTTVLLGCVVALVASISVAYAHDEALTSWERDIGAFRENPPALAGMPNASGYLDPGCNDGGLQTSKSYVQVVGDQVWVYDRCVDGRSGVGYWYTFHDGGKPHRRGTCRNPHGAGTYAVCNKDWGERAPMSISSGDYDAATDRWRRGTERMYFVNDN